MENPEINPHMYGQVIFDREPIILDGEKTVSSVHGAGKIEYPHAKK